MKIAKVGKMHIFMTAHAIERAELREVDTGKIAAMVMAMGRDKLAELIGNDIIITSDIWKISIVASVKKSTVRIFTVVAEAHRFTTDVDKIYIKLA